MAFRIIIEELGISEGKHLLALWISSMNFIVCYDNFIVLLGFYLILVTNRVFRFIP